MAIPYAADCLRNRQSLNRGFCIDPTGPGSCAKCDRVPDLAIIERSG